MYVFSIEHNKQFYILFPSVPPFKYHNCSRFHTEGGVGGKEGGALGFYPNPPPHHNPPQKSSIAITEFNKKNF